MKKQVRTTSMASSSSETHVHDYGSISFPFHDIIASQCKEPKFKWFWRKKAYICRCNAILVARPKGNLGGLKMEQIG